MMILLIFHSVPNNSIKLHVHQKKKKIFFVLFTEEIMNLFQYINELKTNRIYLYFHIIILMNDDTTIENDNNNR